MYSRTLLRLACVALCVGFVTALPARAQKPPGKKGEVQAVGRVSKGLIEEVTNREISAGLPYPAKILGLYFHGSAQGPRRLPARRSRCGSGSRESDGRLRGSHAHGTGRPTPRF